MPSVRKGKTVIPTPNDDPNDDEPVEVEVDDPLSDSCSLCKSAGSSFPLIDEYYLNLVTKCLPRNIRASLLQKICNCCMESLNLFSFFIDKVTNAQNSSQNVFRSQPIKVEPEIEPKLNLEIETKFSSFSAIQNFTPDHPMMSQSNLFTPQKKCEILEIVDIKPFHFDGNLHHEAYDDEDDIQILSPAQLKVELTDPDEDASNELIRNYALISKMVLQDHNYANTMPIDNGEYNVKTEEDDACSYPQQSEPSRICNICNKIFVSYKKFLIHKLLAHQQAKSERSRVCVDCSKSFVNDLKLRFHKKHNCLRDRREIRRICSKIIKRKRRDSCRNVKVQSKKPEKPPQRSKKSYRCETCLKIFSGPKNLYQHKISHATSFYFCHLCDKKFKRPHGLKQHIKSIHEKEKLHICEICKYRYLLKADMLKCRHSKLKKILA